MQSTYSIGDLAREFSVTTRTIRFYEEKGLLKPAREGSRRVYSPADRTKLRLILRGKRLGLSLEESAGIILMYGTRANNRRQLQKLLDTVIRKREELVQQRRDLDDMLQDLADTEEKARTALRGLDKTGDDS
jgi:DNA-binding transcriptional MerR regulator